MAAHKSNRTGGLAIHNLTGYLFGSVRGELEVTVTHLYLFVPREDKGGREGIPHTHPIR